MLNYTAKITAFLDICDTVDLQDLPYMTIEVDMQDFPTMTIEIDFWDLEPIPHSCVGLVEGQVLEEFMLEEEVCEMSLPKLSRAEESVHKDKIKLETPKINAIEILKESYQIMVKDTNMVQTRSQAKAKANASTVQSTKSVTQNTIPKVDKMPSKTEKEKDSKPLYSAVVNQQLPQGLVIPPGTIMPPLSTHPGVSVRLPPKPPNAVKNATSSPNLEQDPNVDFEENPPHQEGIITEMYVAPEQSYLEQPQELTKLANTSKVSENPREMRLEVAIPTRNILGDSIPKLHAKWTKILESKLIRRANPTKMVNREVCRPLPKPPDRKNSLNLRHETKKGRVRPYENNKESQEAQRIDRKLNCRPTPKLPYILNANGTVIGIIENAVPKTRPPFKPLRIHSSVDREEIDLEKECLLNTVLNHRPPPKPPPKGL